MNIIFAILKRIKSIINKLVSFKLCYIYLDSAIGTEKDFEGFKVAPGRKDDLKRLASLVDDKKYCIFEKRMEYKNQLYLLEYKGEIVGYRWLSKDLIIYPETKIVKYLPRNTVYAYDAFISPQFRGKGLFGFFTSKIMDDCIENGVKLGSYSDFSNKSAQRAKEKQGSRKESLILLIKFFDRWEFIKHVKSY